jgi:UDP-3-O-[3-hydroxymyristoyl] glucosamine N-acyltransferase
MITRTLAELAHELGGEVVGDGATVIRGVAGIREAMPGHITFLANSRYEPHLAETRASAVICSREPRVSSIPLLQVDNPYLAFQRIVRVFRPESHRPDPGIHATAVIDPAAVIGEGVSIGPHCVIERGARIGDRAVLMAGCYVGALAQVGDDTFLYPSVTIREECVIGRHCIFHPGVVIGGDGFGYAFDHGRYHKVPQVGNVVIADDVEIGANATIDRATTGSTRIGEGTKIDNLVQIGHNVVVGRHCIIVAQVGIAGSTELEDFVTIGGQAGLIGHIKVGTRATVAGQSGVSKSVPEGAVVTGFPAMRHAAFKRLQAFIQRLPQLFLRAKALEERVAALESASVKEEMKARTGSGTR